MGLVDFGEVLCSLPSLNMSVSVFQVDLEFIISVNINSKLRFKRKKSGQLESKIHLRTMSMEFFKVSCFLRQ